MPAHPDRVRRNYVTVVDLGFGWTCPYCHIAQDEGQRSGVYFNRHPVCASCAPKLSDLRQNYKVPAMPLNRILREDETEGCVYCGSGQSAHHHGGERADHAFVRLAPSLLRRAGWFLLRRCPTCGARNLGRDLGYTCDWTGRHISGATP